MLTYYLFMINIIVYNWGQNHWNNRIEKEGVSHPKLALEYWFDDLHDLALFSWKQNYPVQWSKDSKEYETKNHRCKIKPFNSVL